MAKKKKLPFSMMPASWGLSGKTRAVAEAEYYYDGEELEEVLAEINAETDEDKELAKLDVQLKNEKIGQYEYDKAVAELQKRPYVNVLKLDVNPENAKAGYMELDWNDHFVKFLHQNGYTGENDEAVVNKWFNDVCRTVLLQEMADQDYGLQDQLGMEGQDVVIKQSGNDSEN
tara:strand:+ start:6046 stop:6564 length:519 start_codon:yes stop_codon:yes gene_type:complete